MKAKLLPVALFSAAALFLYVVKVPWLATPDGVFHLQRVRALTEALQAHVLLPRWFTDFTFGYGYPVLNFYSPAFYYPPALLHLAGVDLVVAVQLTLALLFAGSGLALFGFLRSWTSPAAASLGAIAYLFYPYHLHDLYVRGALPEFAAFLWPPLIAYFGYRLWTTSPPARDGLTARQMLCSGNFIGLTLAWTGLVLTHNLSGLMTLLLSVIIFAGLSVIYIYTWLRARAMCDEQSGEWLYRGWPLGLALGLGFMLSAFYLAPALLEARWVTIGAQPETNSYRAHFANWANLFTWSAIYSYPAAADAIVTTPGYALIALLGAAFLLLTTWARGWRLPLGLTLFALLFTLWLTTASSATLWRDEPVALRQLHFPWRWHTLVALLLAILLTLLWERLAKRLAWRWAALLWAGVALYLILYAVLRLPSTATALDSRTITVPQMWEFEAEQGQVGTSWMAEFLPSWVSEQRWAIGRGPTSAPADKPTSAPGFQVQLLRTGYLSELDQIATQQALSLTWPLFYYPAWQVQIDNQPVPTKATTNLGLLTVTLPPGKHLVERRWIVTPAVWLGWGSTGLAALFLCFIFLLGRPTRQPASEGKRWRGQPSPGLWRRSGLILGLCLCIGLFLWPAQTRQPLSIGADYGSVRLEAAMTPPVHPGATAQVTLWWALVGPLEPLTAFVHVVDATGRVVAQQDGPLAGDYRPVLRWLPGQFLSNTHRITLPDTLPPGRYTLKAGLYRPGQADRPLRPAQHNSPDPRVDIGTLEVR